jgi:hypothetical protein
VEEPEPIEQVALARGICPYEHRERSEIDRLIIEALEVVET